MTAPSVHMCHLYRHYSKLINYSMSRPRVVKRLSYSPRSEVRQFDPGRGRWIFSERKNPEYDFLRKGKIRGCRVVDLRHVNEPQVEIRASEQNLRTFNALCRKLR